MPAIVVEGLERAFDEVLAVQGIDIAVEEGEIYGFLGPNGAGKTTTVRMLTTLLLPTGGRASVAGHDVVKEARAVRASIGVALQEAALDPLMTGRELIRLQATLQGIPTAEGRRRADALLERVDLVAAADRRVGGYSGGMKRRLDLAAALVHEPRVLFLDEPTTGLDPVSRKTIWEEVRALNDDGTTVFLTTQYLEEADQLADNVGIIDSGRIVAEGTPESLKADLGNPHIELQLAAGLGRRGGGDPARRSASCCRPRTARRSWSRSRTAPPTSPASSALSTRPGSRSRRWSWSNRPSTTSSSRRPATTSRRRARRTPSRRRWRRERAGHQRPRGAGAGDALDPPDLPPPAADRADHRLPHPAAGDPDRRRQRRGRTARLPAGPELPPVHAGRGDDAVADAGRQQRRHRARGRHRDGLHRPPLLGPDPALRDRPRAPRRDRGAGPLRGRSGSWRSGWSSAPRSRAASPGR